MVGSKGTLGAIVKLIAGAFLALSVIKPMTRLDLSHEFDWMQDYASVGSEAVSTGQSQMRNALAAGIKSRSEAYIINKAKSLNVELKVEVTLSDDEIPIPSEIRLTGKVSPYAKTRLQTIITEDLGIEKERQIWT